MSILLVAGCSAQRAAVEPRPIPTAQDSLSPAPRSAGELAAVAAVRQIGAPYRYGGANSNGFDCSGLVHFAYAQAGVRTPRTTGDLWRQLSPIGMGELKVGDILFFNIAGKVSHVGIYLGDDRFVHAPSSGKEVTVGSLSSSFYKQAVIRGGRLDL